MAHGAGMPPPQSQHRHCLGAPGKPNSGPDDLPQVTSGYRGEAEDTQVQKRAFLRSLTMASKAKPQGADPEMTTHSLNNKLVHPLRTKHWRTVSCGIPELPEPPEPRDVWASLGTGHEEKHVGATAKARLGKLGSQSHD